ncbi:hypothetical protein [Paractinoplanes rishiriensis]|uniref:Uncharacterized protein n=1 Tax=Paractinoplanes rishiriensis TaxID=1050105 RepID=A0A919K2Q9_9ACTN|nr:hypothetical protein [Actinoplanes rishiriensis]GIE97548.1 hypothetical protein Ari01nite_50130 [Actinoplanes rishiriensis]
MRYVANSRMAEGASRDQLVQFFEKNGFSSVAWNLVRHRIVTEYALKTGDVPGVLIFLEADSPEQAAGLINELVAVKQGLLTFEIDPLGKTMRLQADG